jgi:hypothetical protein
MRFTFGNPSLPAQLGHVLREGETYDTALHHYGAKIKIVADANSAGKVGCLKGNPGDSSQPESWQSVGPDSVGDFSESPAPSRWRIWCTRGSLVIEVH